MPRVTKPREGEPIKLVWTKGGEHRYEVVLTVSPPGEPRRQARRRFASLREARAAVDATRDAVRAGRFTATSEMTFAELVTQWTETRRDIRQVSVDGYLTVLAPLIMKHGPRRIQTIGRPQIEAWVAEWPVTGGARGRGLSHRSIVYTLQALRLVFSYAVSIGVISRSPVDGVRAPRKTGADHHEVTVWTVQQLGEFVRVADSDQLAAAWRLAACGLRRSEVLGLDWRSVDLEAGTLKVEQSRVLARESHIMSLDSPKSAASRRGVPIEALLPGTVKVLKAEWLRQGCPSTGLVVMDEASQPVHPDAFAARFLLITKRAGLPRVRLHSLRHCIATALHEAGEPPAAVARLLGHTVATHLAVYVTSSDGSVKRAAERFGQVLSAGASQVV